MIIYEKHDQILQENHTDFSMTKDCKEIGGKFKIIPLYLNLFEKFHNLFRSIVRPWWQGKLSLRRRKSTECVGRGSVTMGSMCLAEPNNF